jgi:hypothetical protein
LKPNFLNLFSMGPAGWFTHQVSPSQPLLAPGPMGTWTPEQNRQKKKVFQTLAEELRTETSAEVILDRLKALSLALDDQAMADTGALVFVRAGGLPTIVRLLMGVATADGKLDAKLSTATISGYAGGLLERILNNTANNGERNFPRELVPHLINALRDAPDFVARVAAAQVLLVLAITQRAQRKAMVDAGVMGAMLAFFSVREYATWSLDKVSPARELACVLVCSETAAMRDLQRVICGPETNLAFTGLVLLHVRHS